MLGHDYRHNYRWTCIMNARALVHYIAFCRVCIAYCRILIFSLVLNSEIQPLCIKSREYKVIVSFRLHMSEK